MTAFCSGTINEQSAPVLQLDDVVAEFPAQGGKKVHAISGVSLGLFAGETLGLVGESGCGKSTLAKVIVQLIRANAGRVVFEGTELTKLKAGEVRKVRRRMQMVFQDPIASLNPWRTVGETIAEPLAIWGVSKAERIKRADEMLATVGLPPELFRSRKPSELSGGECQRVSIARALILEPSLLICDEPVSALDVSVQATIINLLEELKSRYELTMLFISHDLAVVKLVSDRIAVMYLGKLCELAPSATLFADHLHPYTAMLLSAVPSTAANAAELKVLTSAGDLPSPLSPPSGCRFRTRCPRVQAQCADEEPKLKELRPGHWTACHFPG